MCRSFLSLGTLFLALLIVVPSASADCVSGSITAAIEDGGPYDGLYKYTVDLQWDTPQGLSHVTLDCGFGACPAAACAEGWLFATPAGTATGDECTVEFDGVFNCDGDPSIGYTDPIIKWNALDLNGCEAEKTGSAVLCFYTSVAPVPGVLPVILVKNGENVCEGTITGDCPLPCAVPIEATAWGRIKQMMGSEH
jgi:hypothetical protein